MNPKETTEYIKLRGAAIMFLEAEKNYKQAVDSYNRGFVPAISIFAEIRLDAARSVLWDVINDKDLKP